MPRAQPPRGDEAADDEAADEAVGTAAVVSETVAEAVGAGAESEAAAASAAEAIAAAATVAAGKRHKRVLTGMVVSNGSRQSIVVSIARRKKHRLYKKYRTLTKKVMAHDPGNDCQVGDLVRVIESRPLSKMKRWRLVEIVKRAS